MTKYSAQEQVYPAIDDTDLWEALCADTLQHYPARYSPAEIHWAFSTLCHRLDGYLAYDACYGSYGSCYFGSYPLA